MPFDRGSYGEEMSSFGTKNGDRLLFAAHSTGGKKVYQIWKTPHRLGVGVLVVAYAVLLFAIPSSAQFLSVRIQVIDRGQADGILIRTPNQRWIVIDAGTNSQQAEAMRESWNVDTVALAVVSHRHFDHQGGMDEVLRDLPVNLFLGDMQDCPNRSSDDKVRAVINDEDIPVQPLGADTIIIDGVHFTVLPQPPRSECPEDENNNSVVVRLDFGEFSMLFTGDAEVEQLEWLIENHPELLEADVLKASHHGSSNGTSDGWLEAVQPRYVIISAGVDDGYRHPHKTAVDAYDHATGDDVYCTNRHGTVRVYGFSDDRVRVRTQRQTDKSCIYDGTRY